MARKSMEQQSGLLWLTVYSQHQCLQRAKGTCQRTPAYSEYVESNRVSGNKNAKVVTPPYICTIPPFATCQRFNMELASVWLSNVPRRRLQSMAWLISSKIPVNDYDLPRWAWMCTFHSTTNPTIVIRVVKLTKPGIEVGSGNFKNIRTASLKKAQRRTDNSKWHNDRLEDEQQFRKGYFITNVNHVLTTHLRSQSKPAVLCRR